MDINPHEQLIQMLSALLIQQHALRTLVNEHPTDLSTVREGLTVLEQMTRDILVVVRFAEENLPPAELEGVTLAEALSRLVEEAAESLALSSRVSFNGVDEQGRSKERSLLPAADRILYLVAREALYQIQHHVGAHKLRLVLTYGHDEVQMNIEDDGTLPTIVEEVPVPAFASDNGGHAANAASRRNEHEKADTANRPARDAERNELRPYVDLRHRLEHLGGTLIYSAQDQGEKGTRVMARVPYIQSDREAHAAISALPVLPAPATSTATVNAVPATSLPMAPIPSTPAQSSNVRVLVVDGQAVTRAGLHRLLESYDNIQVVGEAADGVQAVSETLELGPQVVLMDAQLPNGQSMEALRQIKQLNLDTKVLLLAVQEREEYLYETLRAGADGYVLKDIAPDELVQAIHSVAHGEVLVQQQLAGKLLSRFGKQRRGMYESLTTRELDVLRLLARGLRNKEIASRLYVSERTVNFHLANIYQKLNVSGRTEALSKALEQGLITT